MTAAPGLRRIGQRLIPWRAAAWWYPAVILGYAAITGLAWQMAIHFGSASGAAVNWPLYFAGLLPSIARDPGPAGE
jgi:hypothetical protein